MASLILKILLTLILVQSLVKFFVFFFVKYDRRRKLLDKSYGDKTSATKLFDNIILVVLLIFVTLLFVSGEMKYLSFTTGLFVGMTLIQVYFHRFSDPLPPEKSPKPPISPIKMMSYGIQAFPKKPWKEIIFMAALFIWALYMLATEGFGL
jgi:hypothetical protein